jgi:hypothetical protein
MLWNNEALCLKEHMLLPLTAVLVGYCCEDVPSRTAVTYITERLAQYSPFQLYATFH